MVSHPRHITDISEHSAGLDLRYQHSQVVYTGIRQPPVMTLHDITGIRLKPVG
jgi:hypothetical protein